MDAVVRGQWLKLNSETGLCQVPHISFPAKGATPAANLTASLGSNGCRPAGQRDRHREGFRPS